MPHVLCVCEGSGQVRVQGQARGGGDRGRVPLGYFQKYVITQTVSLLCKKIFTPMKHLSAPIQCHNSQHYTLVRYESRMPWPAVHCVKSIRNVMFCHDAHPINLCRHPTRVCGRRCCVRVRSKILTSILSLPACEWFRSRHVLVTGVVDVCAKVKFLILVTVWLLENNKKNDYYTRISLKTIINLLDFMRISKFNYFNNNNNKCLDLP